MTKLTALETEILRAAIALLDSPMTCEPLAVISVAAESLGGSHANVSAIHSAERDYSANGALWNHAGHRRASLSAVLRFRT